MIKYSSGQGELFGHYVYDAVFRKRGHILKDLVEAVDFSFVNEICGEAYCEDNGRPGWEPERLFKVTFLQFLYDISDRRVEEEVAFSLIYRYFVGLDPSEEPPDHTTLCRFRKRLGPERFEALFNRIVTEARAKGLIDDKLHIIDSTHITAKVDLFRLKKEEREDDDDDHYVDRSSPDKDARFGRKSPKKGFYGYKAHAVMDVGSEFITGLKSTPGNRADNLELPALSDPLSQTLTADKIYDSKKNREYLADQGIRNAIIPKRRRKGRPPKAEKLRPRIERKFAEAKKYHGLRRSRYWGLDMMAIQTFMVGIVLNLKRWVRLTAIVREATV